MSTLATNRADAAADARRMEASEWVLRLRAESVDEQTTAQWLEWCQRDEGNLAAFESMVSLWKTFDDGRLSTSLKLDLARPGPMVVPVRATPGRMRLPLALAASIALAAGGIAWWTSRDAAIGANTQTLSTAVGSLSRQTLPDGSTVELGAKSAVRVTLTEAARSFVIDNGEAYFKVARDPRRPFTVRVGGVEVVALGTAFSARKSRDRVVVTVQEGVVRITPREEGASGANLARELRATAGHQVVYSGHGRSLNMTRFQAPQATPSAWQVGHLAFVNEPLSAVVADIGRYSPRPIRLADEQLGELVFTGTLRSDAIGDLLSGMEQVFPVRVLDQGERGILIARRAD
jgi:transmembrane sensor